MRQSQRPQTYSRSRYWPAFAAGLAIFTNGGTNPLVGAAGIIQLAQKMMQHQASGVQLKLATS